MTTVTNVLKVISIEHVETINYFIGKVVEFQEFFIDKKSIKNGKKGYAIFWDKKSGLRIKNLETKNITTENWKADPLFNDVEIGEIVEGKIVT